MNKTLFFIIALLDFLCVVPSFSSSENLKPSYDSKVEKKHLKHHRHLKAKKSDTSLDSTPQGSQEEVTDQREVSQQSDKTGHKNK